MRDAPLPRVVSALGAALLAALVSGCEREAPTPPVQAAAERIPAGEWVLGAFEDGSSPESKPPTIEIDADGRFTGFGGCNRYFGEAKLTEGKLEFGPFGSTRMACPEPAMGVEDRYFAALGQVKRYRRSDNALELLDADGALVLRFIRPAPSD